MEKNQPVEESKAPLSPFSGGVHVLALLFIVSLSTGFFWKLGNILTQKLYGITDISAVINNAQSVHTNIDAVIFFQILTSIGTFIIPAILFSCLLSLHPLSYLKLDKKVNPRLLFLTFVLFLCAGVVIDVVIRIMHYIPFSEMENPFIQSMLEMEKLTENIFAAFLSFNSVGGFFAVFFMMAIIPAIGEELIFRGLLQNIFLKGFKNPTIAILFASFLFALIHFQLYNFPALMLMGILLGLVYHWTGNLWYSIASHLFNNGLIVVLTGLAKLGWIEFDFQTQANVPLYITIIGICIFVPLLLFYKKQASQTREA